MTVVISGTNVNMNASFNALGLLSMMFMFPINDDSVSLEDDEAYMLNLMNPVPNERIFVGGPTRILIRDDDRMFQF